MWAGNAVGVDCAEDGDGEGQEEQCWEEVFSASAEGLRSVVGRRIWSDGLLAVNKDRWWWEVGRDRWLHSRGGELSISGGDTSAVEENKTMC